MTSWWNLTTLCIFVTYHHKYPYHFVPVSMDLICDTFLPDSFSNSYDSFPFSQLTFVRQFPFIYLMIEIFSLPTSKSPHLSCNAKLGTTLSLDGKLPLVGYISLPTYVLPPSCISSHHYVVANGRSAVRFTSNESHFSTPTLKLSLNSYIPPCMNVKHVLVPLPAGSRACSIWMP